MAKLKSAAKRELINTGKTTDQHRQDKRFVGRGANGQFKASDDVTLSLKRDRHGGKRKVTSRQVDWSDM